MQGNSADGLNTNELLHLLTDLTRDAQEFAAQCLSAAERLVDAELGEDAGELDLEVDGWVPDTFPAEWVSN